ncbi:WD40/YVTN/BNR-like repeat-containing protein [Pedobacter sp.]|uniref:WD40/YVTN/BNR-like repeat-containing protein n=1 Tax=Pedobacter sp. TaxID=1411316 RepID=UPI003D7FD404
MRFLSLLFFLWPAVGFSQNYQLVPLPPGPKTSIRGLSVVSDQVAWVSGSHGYVGKTTNGGATWQWMQPEGKESLDFRDIQAFNSQKAIIVNAGSPANILVTLDGGKTWKTTYHNADPAIFLDGMDFWNANQGIIFGDPIEHHMQLLRTNDGGMSWTNISDRLKLNMAEGEAGFAASGTTIKVLGKGKVWISTGGIASNIYYSKDYGQHWSRYPLPIWSGANSTGPFSMDFLNEQQGIVVGGDYLQDELNTNNILLTSNGGKEWKKPRVPVTGYRSGVKYINKRLCIAVGTSGVDISTDGGQTWRLLSELSFNAVGASKDGKLVLLAGGNGLIYKLK